MANVEFHHHIPATHLPLPPDHTGTPPICAPVVPQPDVAELLFPYGVGALVILAVYFLVFRPLMTRGFSVSAFVSAAQADAKSIGGMIQSFVLSKWTWIIGIGGAAVAASYLYHYLWLTLGIGFGVVVLLDVIANSTSTSALLVLAKSAIGTVEGELKSLGSSAATAIASEVNSLTFQVVKVTAPVIPESTLATPATTAPASPQAVQVLHP